MRLRQSWACGRPWLWLALVLWAGGPTSALGQDAKQDFIASVVGKQLMLRNFSAETEVRYRWTGSHLTAVESKFFTFGILTPEQVSYTSHGVMISGFRQTALLDTKTHLLVLNPVQQKVRLSIDLGSAEFTDVLPKLRGAIFFDTFRQAAEEVPASARSLAPLHVDGSSGVAPLPPQASQEASITPPKLVKAVEPEYTDDARDRKVEGDVRCGIVVSDTGKVDSVWLLRPIGSGLDESAMKAVAQYRFDPARQDGKAVSVVIKTEVHFQIERR